MKFTVMMSAWCLFVLATCVPANAQNNYNDEGNRTNRQGAENRQSNRQSSRQQSDAQQSDRQQSDARKMIERHDENDDGVLQESELPRSMRDSFSQRDRNGNDELSASELREHARQMRRSIVPVEVVCVWVNDVDQGRLSVDDLQTAYETLSNIDDNGDGKISKSELQQRRQELASKWAKQVVSRLDENDDGQVNEDEAADSFVSRNFDQIDNNSDGKISRQELSSSLASTDRGQQEQGTRSARRSEDQTR